MMDTPEDIQQKIAQLEAMRSTLGDAAVDAAIATLRAQQHTQTTSQQQVGVNVGINHGIVQQFFGSQSLIDGLNQGTVQQFFGTTTPPEDHIYLLFAYLASLTSECQHLRLNRLVDQSPSGTEQQPVPHFKLQAVYTGLTTNGEPVLMHQREYPAARMKRLYARLRERKATEVPPEQVREINVDFSEPRDNAFYIRIGKELNKRLHKRNSYNEPDDDFYGRIGREHDKTLTWEDVPDDEPLCLTITRPELATEAIQQNHRLVLLGEPGSGKSTVLRYLALLLALRIQEQAIDLPPGWHDTTLPVPILCPLGTVAEVMRAHDLDPDRALWQAITQALDDKQHSRAGLRDHLRDAIQRGGVLLLFDGLDELPTSGDNPRQQVAQTIARFAIQAAPNARIVVTSRVLAYQAEGDWKLPDEEGWQTRTIQPLKFGQVRQFVQQWYAELITPDLSAGAARQMAQQLLLTLIEMNHLQKLVASPLLLTMLVILHYNRNALPDDRVEVYEQCVELLLDRWEPRRTPGVAREGLLARLAIPDLKLEQLREELHKLALQAQEQPPSVDGRGMLDRYMLTGRLVEFFARLRCPDPLAKVYVFIDGLVQEAGLLQAPADDRYAFPHLTFQEYLAACGLADKADWMDHAYSFWQSADAARWREVLLLLAGRLRVQGSRTIEREAVPWLKRLAVRRIGRQEKTITQCCQDAVLAAHSYRELGERTAFVNSSLDIEEEVEAPIRDAIVYLLDMPNNDVSLEDRLTAAQLLADLGDPRFPVTLDEWRVELARRNETFGTPDGYWCHVGSGSYRISGWQEGEQSTNIALSGFWIARYPLTVAQYASFINDGGYQQQDYWTPEGWKFIQENNRTQPRRWDDAQYNSPNQAVIGVSWYECMAFCAWLTAQLADVLPEGYAVQLPTEAEWEVAAAYDAQMQRRIYPWGHEEPTPEHAIFQDEQGNHLDTPAPVGICPAGAAACGALDMGGNVWEWTTNSEDFIVDDHHRVPTRGGSLNEPAYMLRCAARKMSRPDDGHGFRLVLTPKATLHPFKEDRYYTLLVIPTVHEATVGQFVQVRVELVSSNQADQAIKLPYNIPELHCFISPKGLRTSTDVQTIPLDEQMSEPRLIYFELQAELIGDCQYHIELFIDDPDTGRIDIHQSDEQIITIAAPEPGEERPPILAPLDIHVVRKPDVVLYIKTDMSSNTTDSFYLVYYMTCHLPNMRINNEEVGRITVEPGLLEHVRSVLHQTLQTARHLQPDDAHERMLSFGSYLFELLFPEESSARFRGILDQLADHVTTWLIVHDQYIWLPWELVVPKPPHKSTPLRSLAERYHISRWIDGLGLEQYHEIPVGEIALAYYTLIDNDELQAWRQVLIAELAQGISEIIKTETPVYGLHLLRYIQEFEERDILVRDQPSSMSQAKQEETEARLRLRQKRPIVTMSVIDQHPDYSSFFSEDWSLLERILPFFRAGASVVAGAWWPTQESADRIFWTSFYDLVVGQRMSPGEAAWRARRAVRIVLPNSIDWLAYTFVGNPLAQPYIPEDSQGYTALECLNPDEEFYLDKTYYFRASIRRYPPAWYRERLVRTEDFPEQARALFLAPGLQTKPPEPIVMQPTGRAMLSATVGLTPTAPGEHPLLVQLFEGDEHLATLQTILQVNDVSRAE